MTEAQQPGGEPDPQNPQDPQQPAEGQQPQEQAPGQETPLTAEDVLGAEQTPEAAAADGGEPEAPEEASEAERRAQEHLEDLRRLQAEFVNYKNRTGREREQLRDQTVGQVVAALIPVIDDIDAARGAGDLEDGPFAAIARKLEEALSKQGLERIGQVGEAFDPTVHEAVLQQPAEGVEEDHISLVLRSGFRVGDRVVRAAQVAVAPAS